MGGSHMTERWEYTKNQTALNKKNGLWIYACAKIDHVLIQECDILIIFIKIIIFFGFRKESKGGTISTEQRV